MVGLLAAGEQLPGETELAGQLGVSTVTLREALMALRQQGLVTTRRGRGGGSFVALPEVPGEERLKARLRGWSTEELRAEQPRFFGPIDAFIAAHSNGS